MDTAIQQASKIVERLMETSEMLESDESVMTSLLSIRAAKGDLEAITLFALFYMMISDVEKCNVWTLIAGEHGAREVWVNNQSTNPWHGYLAVRLDALQSLEKEKLSTLDASMAIQYHLFEKISDQSFYYAVKAIVFIYEALGEEKAFEFLHGILTQNKSKINEGNETLIFTSFSTAISPFYFSKLLETL